MTDKFKPSDAAASRATFGFMALLSAFLIIFLQAIAAGTTVQWANLLALVLAITGTGLRIEAILLRKES
ncbi:hypothetical protein CDG81_13815 [Actinopolyspora erythraea]|uniref:Uncharacterized protein n=1 Tax=Actinopolyspora erythraea TaxID=414996 RepID=A0A099D3Y2_9ACTN|nr:hypothetical protein [Actinopolyspora erythraea]ASU79189.1 hypothetical protein CDG81_13815 [Actinopolyspora erythraea]KGI80636.1 hypothetical protein IL38_15990 [Actinopolyspora erythraea]